MSSYRKVCGVGINDADYTVSKIVDGRRCDCKFYIVWKAMLSKCYSRKLCTNKGLTVCEDWKKFSNFKKWMESQNYGDRLYIKSGESVYSPESCSFDKPDPATKKPRDIMKAYRKRLSSEGLVQYNITLVLPIAHRDFVRRAAMQAELHEVVKKHIEESIKNEI